uniref:Uncharacterized protein n=1 Tax=Kuenenia stuttgartiensis TaxID=174633 RepID=Q1PUI4_KUEST|nr:unknown protein [Candidatus Kuenenia stuttgartiensis]
MQAVDCQQPTVSPHCFPFNYLSIFRFLLFRILIYCRLDFTYTKIKVIHAGGCCFVSHSFPLMGGDRK